MTHPIRCGAVGLGRLGWLHAEHLAGSIPGAALTAVCSIVESELDNAKATWSGVECYASFDRMLEMSSLDAVVLASPSSLHCSQVESALNAGVHVFCEKPLGVGLDECERVAAMVEARPDQVFMLGFMRRYDPSYQFAKERIEQGEIGRPILFRGYSVDPIDAIESALRYAPHSAGQFLDMAIHDIDLARWFLEAEPVSLYAAGGCFAFSEFGAYGDGDNVSALIKFDNQTMVFLLAGRTAPHGYHVETEIIGTKAALRIGHVPALNRVDILDPYGVRTVCEQHFTDRFSEAFLAELKEFVACIRERRQPGITVRDGVAATAIALAATRSFQNNELIHF